MSDFNYNPVLKADELVEYSFADLIASMENLEDAYVPFFGGFYGDPGTRKTVSAMKLAQIITPPDKKILYVHTGAGWTSFKNHPELKNRVKIQPYKNYEQLFALQALMANPALREKVGIGCIIFDEFNRMQDADMARLVKGRAKTTNEAGMYDKKTGLPIYKDPDTPEWPDYNTQKARMIDLMVTLLSIKDTHTIFVCHTKVNKATGFAEPDFPTAAASAFTSQLHSLYRTDKLDVMQNDGTMRTDYVIELQGTAGSASKNRIGGMPTSIPTDGGPEFIAKAFNKWNENKESSVVKNTVAPAIVETPTEVKQETDILSDLGI